MKKKTAVKRKVMRRQAAPMRVARSPGRAAVQDKNGDDPQPEIAGILQEVARQDTGRRLDHWEQVSCPYCGEDFEVHIDSAEDGQTLHEDCQVCCKPISLQVQVEEEEVSVSVARS